MTVRELIRELQSHDLDDEVHVYAGGGQTDEVTAIGVATNRESGRVVVALECDE